jgi:hypothetical protein
MSCPTCVTFPEQLVGYGAMLQYCDLQTQEWVTVGGTKDLEFMKRTRKALETTNNDGDGATSYMPSPLMDTDTVTYNFDFLQNQFIVLSRIFEQNLILNWRVVLNNNVQTYMQFCGFIVSDMTGIPMKELVNSDIELQRAAGVPIMGELNP